jgi:hypothetical protein
MRATRNERRMLRTEPIRRFFMGVSVPVSDLRIRNIYFVIITRLAGLENPA